MNQTTRTISLVLICSALVFVGWGCPLAHEDDEAHHDTGSSRSHYRTGHSWFWYSSYGYGRGGQFTSPSQSGSSTGHTGSVSSRGGFGSTGGGLGATGIS